MAALLATSLLATACPRPDAQPAVLATSAIFVNNTPSAANYLAAVTLPPAAPTNMSYGMALEAVSP